MNITSQIIGYQRERIHKKLFVFGSATEDHILLAFFLEATVKYRHAQPINKSHYKMPTRIE